MKFSLAFLIALALSGVANINAVPIRSSNELADVLDEFLALVPEDKVVEIFQEYLSKDSEVQAVVEYMKSDGFRELVKKVESIDDVINFYAYLAESGLDIYTWVNKFHDFIGLPPLMSAKSARDIKITGGFSGLFEDIMAVLPIDAIEALYYEKLETSPAFAELVERFRSPRFQELVNALRANEEFRKIVAFFREAGIDLNAIKDLLTALFGLEFPELTYSLTANLLSEIAGIEIPNKLLSLHKPKSPLERDLQEFVNLLPWRKLRRIIAKHFVSDKEFQRTIIYLRSTEFHELVRKLHDIPEYNDFLKSLEEAGLDVEALIKRIHRFINFPKSVSSDYTRNARSISSFIDEMIAVFPINDIKLLYHEKLETSEDFAHLVEIISSEQFQAVTDALFADETFRDILYKAQGHGIDLQAISDFFLTIFGIKTPPGVIN